MKNQRKNEMARRRNNSDVGYGKHRFGLQFNPNNGEPHTKSWLDANRRGRKRREVAK